MGTLYLVRHGQASFGADDYDHLSELGHAQARRLGQYWRESLGPALRFDAVLTGTLRRQVQTWQGIAEGAALAGTPHTRLPGLDEYDSHAVIAAIHPEPLPKPDTPERYRAHFRNEASATTMTSGCAIAPRSRIGSPIRRRFRLRMVSESGR